MKLKYKVEGQGTITHEGLCREDLIKRFEGHRDDPSDGFGSRELLTIPVIYTNEGHTDVWLNYNGMPYIPVCK